MVNVSWNDAQAFIQWLNKTTGKQFTLPSEAQWEYACRGGTDTIRFWGNGEDGACGYANAADEEYWSPPAFSCEDGYFFTAPVGSYQPNGFGLNDMLGNVLEWCQDRYAKNAYKNHDRDNNGFVLNNMLGNVWEWCQDIFAQSGSSRVDRGGGWCSDPAEVRCASRGWNPQDFRCNGLGFRLLRIN